MDVHWLAAHFYVAALAVVGTLVVGGVFLVHQRAAVDTTSSITWGGAGGVALFGNSGNGGTTGNQRVPTADILRGQERPADYILPTFTDEIGMVPVETVEGAQRELKALLAQITDTGSAPAPVTNSGAEIYSFIPQGLISIDTGDVEYTDAQLALYDYGNIVGGHIRGFELSHQHMITTIKDAYEDRGNAAKVAAAEQIGTDYIHLGEDLSAIDLVPDSVRGMHEALANSYKAAGEKHIAKFRTQNDEDFLKAVEAYNASAREFIRSYLALVTYFDIAGVRFRSSDPGSVFMFNAAAAF